VSGRSKQTTERPTAGVGHNKSLHPDHGIVQRCGKLIGVAGEFNRSAKKRPAVRRLSCDQYEFDPPGSEQALDLAIASPSRLCPDLAALLLACGASAQDGPPPPADWVRWGEVAAHLERFAGVALPHPTQVRAAVLLRDEWDDVELGVAFGSVLLVSLGHLGVSRRAEPGAAPDRRA
jgi:hypothetical protein